MVKNNAVTIYDIAEMAGTSPRSVTRAFQENSEISEKTRQRILEIANRVGYRPNRAAGRMRGKPLTIGYVIMNSVDVFSLELIRGAKMAGEALADFKTELLIRCCGTPEESTRAMEELLAHPIDGIVVYGGNDITKDVLQKLQERNIPILTTDMGLYAEGVRANVMVDTTMKGSLGATLLSMLCPGGNIVYFSGSLHQNHHIKILEGFRREAEKSGITVSAVYDTKDIGTCAAELAETLIRENIPCDGVFFASANSAPAIEVFKKHGFHPTIVASDIFPEMSEYIREGTVAATIYQNPAKQARLAVMNMYTYLTEKREQPPQILITPQIVIRSNLHAYEYQEPTEIYSRL